MQNLDDPLVEHPFEFVVVPKQLHAELHSIDLTKLCFEKPLKWYDAADYWHFRIDAKLLFLAVQPAALQVINMVTR